MAVLALLAGLNLAPPVFAAVQAGATVQPGSADVRTAASDQAGDAGVRARLGTPEPMTPEEISRAIETIARTIRGRAVRATDGAETVTLDAQGRDVVLAVLSGTLPIQDVGLKQLDGATVRGFRSPATPPRVEIGAKQTLWIDVQRLEPRRFELVSEVPGMGDASFDLRIE